MWNALCTDPNAGLNRSARYIKHPVPTVAAVIAVKSPSIYISLPPQGTGLGIQCGCYASQKQSIDLESSSVMECVFFSELTLIWNVVVCLCCVSASSTVVSMGSNEVVKRLKCCVMECCVLS